MTKSNTISEAEANADLERNRRIISEREFHNARFSEEVRDAQGKYYACIRHGSWEFDKRIMALAEGADVLEYGCGSAIQAEQIGRTARSLTGIDISDVAVAKANAFAEAKGLSNTHYVAMDAEDMTFPDGSFDLVFGRGIIHHLDLERSFASITRVLRPGGKALFWEPLGHNPILNRYRDMTPEARTPDEHPLLKADFDLAGKYFSLRQVRFYGLTTILTVPMRDTTVGNAVLTITSAIDKALFATPLRWLAWYALIELEKPDHETA